MASWKCWLSAQHHKQVLNGISLAQEKIQIQILPFFGQAVLVCRILVLQPGIEPGLQQ